MTDEKLVSAYLQNQTLEQAEEYVKRGRSLAGEGTEELKQRWIKAFQQWVKSVKKARRQHQSERGARDDIEAELLIKNVDFPYDAVKKETTSRGFPLAPLPGIRVAGWKSASKIDPPGHQAAASSLTLPAPPG